MRTIFDVYSKNEIEEIIEKINSLIEKNLKDIEIKEGLDCEFIEELISIARARIKNSKDSDKKISVVNYFNLFDLRFSTPQNVADYRAKRLKCDKIIDLCSGTGCQAFAFANESKDVYSFEIDERKIKYAQENFNVKKNLKFIQGDILEISVINEVKKIKPDIIFCDPERLGEEKERTLENIKPDIKKILESYLPVTNKICIEVPPQINIDKLKNLGNFEAEYLSVNNKLNRLNLYFNQLKKCNISVVDPESFERIENDYDSLPELEKYNLPLKYIYEVSSAVIKADLIKELGFSINAGILNLNSSKVLLTTNNLADKFLSFYKCFEVIATAINFLDCIKVLRKNSFGKIILRGDINPDNYWKERNKIENMLSGKSTCDLFIVNNKKNQRRYFVCKEI